MSWPISTSLVSDQDGLRRRLAEDGYVFFRLPLEIAPAVSPAQGVGRAAVLGDQLAGGGLGRRLAGHPFGDQGPGQAVVAGPGRGGDEGQVDDVTLRVAPADRIGPRPDVDEQVDGPVGAA